VKLLYKPLGIVAGLLASKAAGSIFKKLWMLVAKQTEAPKASEQYCGWGEVFIAAALQGAVFGGVKALVDRASATGFARITGTWPGPTSKPKSE
jgi:Protein of unknown function (DUF4235)